MRQPIAVDTSTLCQVAGEGLDSTSVTTPSNGEPTGTRGAGWEQMRHVEDLNSREIQMDTQKGWFFSKVDSFYKDGHFCFLCWISGVYLWLKLVIFQASHLGFQEGSLRNTQENKQKSKHKHTEKQKHNAFLFSSKNFTNKCPTTGRGRRPSTQL